MSKPEGTVCRFLTVQINSTVACFVGFRDDDLMNILPYNLDNYFNSAYEPDFCGALAARTALFYWLLDQFDLIAYVDNF